MKQAKFIAIMLIGFAVMVIAMLTWSRESREFGASFFFIALSAAVLTPTVAAVLSGKIPWYSPHAFVVASLGMMYVMAPALVIVDAPPSDYYKRALAPEEMLKVVQVTTLGIFCYIIGYRIGPKNVTAGRRLEAYFSETPSVQQILTPAAFVIWGIGVAAWAYIYGVQGGVGASLQRIGERSMLLAEAGGLAFHLSKFLYVGMLLLIARMGMNIITVPMLGFSTLVLLVFGSRSYIGLLVLGALIVWRFRHLRRVPLIVWAGGAVGGFFLMAFYVILRGTRGNVADAAHYFQESMSRTSSWLTPIVAPFTFINEMGEVINNMGGRISYQYGETFLTLFYFIPGWIWPGKYNIDPANMVYMKALFPDRIDRVTITPSIMAEFYMNFGWGGIVVLSLMLGVFIKWFSNAMIAHPNRKYQNAWIVFSALAAVNVMRVLKNGSTDAVWLLYFLVPLVMVYFPNIGLFFSPPPRGALLTDEDPRAAAGEDDDGFDDDHEFAPDFDPDDPALADYSWYTESDTHEHAPRA